MLNFGGQEVGGTVLAGHSAVKDVSKHGPKRSRSIRWTYN
jgi:hypothetical protein